MSKSRNIKITYIYSDGSVINNGKPYASGGIGVFFRDNDSRNVSEKFTISPITTPRSEMYAVYKGLEKFILDKGKKFFLQKKYTTEEIHVYSDSSYVVKSMNSWIKNWKRNGWKNRKGESVLNIDILIKLDNVINAIKPQVRTRFFHINSHMPPPSDKYGLDYQHWYGNKMADELASKGRKQK